MTTATHTLTRPQTNTRPYAVEGNEVVLRFHRSQWRAWDSQARIVAIIAGTQGGKTSFGPLWMLREMARRGPGDYLVAAPTYPLLGLKTIPEYRRYFERVTAVATYTGSPVRKLTITEAGQEMLFGRVYRDETSLFFGHAQDPDSLESMTAKAAHGDECGQKKFKLGSYEAVMRRLSISEGRLLITTTPYNLGWLKTRIHDPAVAGSPDIDLVRFRSIDNPAFPRSEWDRARSELPAWKFDLFYRAIFTRPAGLIYDCFDEVRHVVRPFAIPDEWPRYSGHDFGGVNTAAVFLALDPASGQLYVYREYHAGGRTSAGHVAAQLDGEPRIPLAFGGAPSEDQWRKEFSVAGYHIRRPPISDVEVGIDRVYVAIKDDRLRVFDTCPGLIDEFASYSRVLDENSDPTEAIENKNAYHRLDALRYIMAHLNRRVRESRIL